MTELTAKQIKSFGFMVPPRGPKYLPPDVKKQIEKLLASPSLAKKWKEKYKNIIGGRQPKPIPKNKRRAGILTDVKSRSVREPLKRVRDFAAAYPSARSKKATPISTSPTTDVPSQLRGPKQNYRGVTDANLKIKDTKSTSTDAKPPQLRKPKDDRPVVKPRRKPKQSDELETSIRLAREKGDHYYFNKKLGKKMAAVTKEDLEKSGLGLTAYMNRLTGLDSPGAFESKSKRKAPPLPKRKPQRKLSTKEESEVKAGLEIRDALKLQAGKAKVRKRSEPILPIEGVRNTRGILTAGWDAVRDIGIEKDLSEAEETELFAKWKEEKKQSRKKPDAKKSRTGNTDYRKGGLFY